MKQFNGDDIDCECSMHRKPEVSTKSHSNILMLHYFRAVDLESKFILKMTGKEDCVL